MTTPSTTLSTTSSARKPKAFLPILVGAFAAGSLDLAAAFILYGKGVPCVIAAGLLGRRALDGGLGTAAIGIGLHFFIAASATAVYYAASRTLEFLKDHFFVCGLFYGIAVYLVMNLIVLPLSGLHSRGPYRLTSLIEGLLVHMFCIGLPIAFSVRRFSK
jgi:hypothetical protein